MSLPSEDKGIVRDLARRVAEIACLPEQDEKRDLWIRLNRLERVRPLIHVQAIDHSIWAELIPDEQKAGQLDSRRRRLRGVRLAACPAILFLSAFLLTPGCDQGSVAGSIRLGDRSETHVGLDHEWRLGWEFAAGSIDIEVPGHGDNGYLRLGVLPRKDNSTPVKVRVSVGADVLLEETVSVSSVWHDRLIEIPGGATGECAVHIEAPGPLALGPCEIVPACSSKPNVLIFLVDALRLDHVGCYGYERQTTPHIDAFAEDAVRFTHLMPQASWTRPSVASLLTST